MCCCCRGTASNCRGPGEDILRCFSSRGRARLPLRWFLFFGPSPLSTRRTVMAVIAQLARVSFITHHIFLQESIFSDSDTRKCLSSGLPFGGVSMRDSSVFGMEHYGVCGISRALSSGTRELQLWSVSWDFFHEISPPLKFSRVCWNSMIAKREQL